MSKIEPFEYPFINTPPIVLNSKKENMEDASTPSSENQQDTEVIPSKEKEKDDLEAFTPVGNTKAESNLHPFHSEKHKQNKPTITFIPKVWGGSELLAIHGEYNHPERHILKQHAFIPSTTYKEVEIKNTRKPKSCSSHTQQMLTAPKPPSRGDEELMKYYVAGISVVGLLILYRILSREK